MRSVTPESLSEHTTEVAFIAHALALIGNTYFGKSYNVDRAAALALYHDAPEVFTGDLPTPIKYFSPETKRDYSAIEDNAISTLLSKLPAELRASYEEMLKPSPEDNELHKLVKIADKLCAYIKCLTEEAAGNNEFLSAKKSTLKALKSINSPELEYFMNNLLTPFTVTIDEM